MRGNERGRIVEAIAHHQDLSAFAGKLLHQFGFVGGQNAAVIIVDAKIVGKLLHRRLLVAGNDAELEAVAL